MARYFVIAISFFLLLSACSQPMVYNGDRLPKTKVAEVYYSAAEVKKPFKVIGHIKAHKYADNIVKRDLVYFGQSVGADAVIVTGGDSKYVNADAIKFD
jgi:hypothetical protein